MKKLSIEQWAAVSICIAIPAFLMYQNHDSGIFGTAVISYATLAGIEECKKNKATRYAPLVGYIAMIVYGAVKIANTNEVFYNERTEVLVNIVKYGAILLLAIPFLYKKRGL